MVKRGQILEVEAEAVFKDAEQNVIFHSENICCEYTARSSISSLITLHAFCRVTVRIVMLILSLRHIPTSSSAVANRPRDTSCLSVVS